MILFPAIDLKDGECVRLVRGEMATATAFNKDPSAQASIFAEQGFKYLHVVDLDGALAGRPVNAEAVERILATVTLPMQLGGGIRNMATVDAWLASGVSRVIIGTAALHDPEFVRLAARQHPNRIAVAIDARDGLVAVEGWVQTSQIEAVELARRFADAGVATIIHTDISRDGLLSGLNVEATLALARGIDVPVIASGGLASLEDIRRLVSPDCACLEGAIAGRALYTGDLNARQALALIETARRHAHA